jgi:hypothetical protein
MVCHKIKYSSHGEAATEATLLTKQNRRRKGKVSAYLCPKCNSYHVGHEYKRRKKKK